MSRHERSNRIHFNREMQMGYREHFYFYWHYTNNASGHTNAVGNSQSDFRNNESLSNGISNTASHQHTIETTMKSARHSPLYSHVNSDEISRIGDCRNGIEFLPLSSRHAAASAAPIAPRFMFTPLQLPPVSSPRHAYRGIDTPPMQAAAADTLRFSFGRSEHISRWPFSQTTQKILFASFTGCYLIRYLHGILHRNILHVVMI